MSKVIRYADSLFGAEILKYMKENEEAAETIRDIAQMATTNALFNLTENLLPLFTGKLAAGEVVKRADNLLQTMADKLTALEEVAKNNLGVIADIYSYVLQAEGKKF